MLQVPNVQQNVLVILFSKVFFKSYSIIPKLSRHIKVNLLNIALLQEATQKYQKHTDYWTKCCFLSPLLSVYCDLCFLHLPQWQSFFSSWTQYSTKLCRILKSHKWSLVPYIILFSGLKIVFSKLILAKYHCLH